MKCSTILALIFLLTPFVYGRTQPDTASQRSGADTARGREDYGELTVRSEPEGAEVFDDSVYLGRTPISKIPVEGGGHLLRLFYPRVSLWNAIVLQESITVVPSRENTTLVKFDSSIAFPLTGMTPARRSTGPHPVLSLSESDVGRSSLEYVSGGVMILSGVLSAYLKTQSDNKFNTYITNRDPVLLGQVHRLDAWAGASLAVTELSFAILTYLFLSD